MYIEAVPNRNSPPAILLRESFREGGKVKKRTLLNLSDWPPALVEGMRALLQGGTVLPLGEPPFAIRRAWPHGHVAAVLGTLRGLALDRLLGEQRGGRLVRAMIVARLLEPASKLATAKALSQSTAGHSVAPLLGLGEVDENELYIALDWLLERQPVIEAALAKQHLSGGTLVLYDVSSYLEGRHCELAGYGHSRDNKPHKLQIIYGLLYAVDGCPVAIEVFDGNTGDPTTLSAQIAKIKQRFALDHVILVGDRGMITAARIDRDLRPARLDWITALRAPQIRALVDGGALQPSLFDERDMAAITSPDYPSERLIVCRNPDLAAERGRKREDLLQATERDLAAVAVAVARPKRPLRALRPSPAASPSPLSAATWPSISPSILPTSASPSPATPRRSRPRPRSTGSMPCAPRFPPTASTTPASSPPIRASVGSNPPSVRSRPPIWRSAHSTHRRGPRVRAHVFLCMLAYYVEWHLRTCLAPMLTNALPPTRSAPARWPKLRVRRLPGPKTPAAKPRTGCASTVCTASSPTSPPSPAMRSPPVPLPAA
jgi:hypothetical protein